MKRYLTSLLISALLFLIVSVNVCTFNGDDVLHYSRLKILLTALINILPLSFAINYLRNVFKDIKNFIFSK